MDYIETPAKGKKNKLFKKKELNMEAKVKSQVKHSKTAKKKSTLSIYTYMNWKQFGVAGRFEDGIKLTFLWFETHITFEKR